MGMIPAEAIEAAAKVLRSQDDTLTYPYPVTEYLNDARAILEAAAPYMQDREQIQIEALTHARAVITQWLSTAEKWRYDQVCSDFQEMIDAAAAGELVRPPQVIPTQRSMKPALPTGPILTVTRKAIP